jgi:lincosamide nucleotidyltransferase
MSVHSARSALDDRIARLRQLAHTDTRLEGVLLYGSWTVGEADAHSDIEAYLYIQDDRLADFDGPGFLAQLAPLQLSYTNMYGILAVVFDDLMRGEFHLTPAGPGIDEVPTWQSMVHLPRPDDAVLLDRTGRLIQAARQLATFQPPEPVTTAQQLTDELTNWTLMLAHVLARGEIARAHALLHTVIAPQQLQLCRPRHHGCRPRPGRAHGGTQQLALEPRPGRRGRRPLGHSPAARTPRTNQQPPERPSLTTPGWGHRTHPVSPARRARPPHNAN